MDERDLRTCEACGKDTEPRNIMTIGVEPNAGDDDLTLCTDCVSECHDDTGVEIDSDVLDRGNWDKVNQWVKEQHDTRPVSADMILRVIGNIEEQCKQVRMLLTVKQVEVPITPTRQSVAEHVALALSKMGVVCFYEVQPGFISVPLVDGCSWAIGQANECWSGELLDITGQATHGSVEEDYYNSEIPSDCDDVERIATSIKAFLDHDGFYKRNVNHPLGAA